MNKSLADIDSSTEALNAAKLNLTYTKVYAEVDGYVSNINFQIGTQATANKPLLALVDTSSFWVFGFFKEDAIPQVRVGDNAVEPVFQWIRLAQRIPVRIKLNPLPDDVKLRVGMTASVQILKHNRSRSVHDSTLK